MRHSYIDRYASIDSFIHRIDPRLKIVVCLIFIISTVLANPSAYLYFFLSAFILFFLILASKIPIIFIIKKSLVVIPFVILVAICIPFIKGTEGITLFWGIVIKSYLSILCMMLLTSSTKFIDLLRALERLRLPRIFIMILSFMYRYSFLLVDEIQRMQRARESRSFGTKNRFAVIRTLSNIVGVLFLRSYERAERVYLAMCSRGFKGGAYNPDKKS